MTLVRARDDLENWHKLLELIDKEQWQEARKHAVKWGFASGVVKWGFNSKGNKGKGITTLQHAYRSNDLDYMSTVLEKEINDKSEMLAEIISRLEEETEQLSAPIIVGDKYYFRSYYEFIMLTDFIDVEKYAADTRITTNLLKQTRGLGFDVRRIEDYFETDNRPFFEELERRKNATLLYQYKGVIYPEASVLVLYNEELHSNLRKSTQDIIRMLLHNHKDDFSVIVADEDSLEKSKMCEWKKEKFPELEPVKRVMKLRNESNDWKKIALFSRLKRNTFIYVWKQIDELGL